MGKKYITWHSFTMETRKGVRGIRYRSINKNRHCKDKLHVPMRMNFVGLQLFIVFRKRLLKRHITVCAKVVQESGKFKCK